jgi:hypothetical protein
LWIEFKEEKETTNIWVENKKFSRIELSFLSGQGLERLSSFLFSLVRSLTGLASAT